MVKRMVDRTIMENIPTFRNKIILAVYTYIYKNHEEILLEKIL